MKSGRINLHEYFSGQIICNDRSLLRADLFFDSRLHRHETASTQKNITAFRISVIAFLFLPAACIFFFVSPLLSNAPLFPFYLFIKLFLAA